MELVLGIESVVDAIRNIVWLSRNCLRRSLRVWCTVFYSEQNKKGKIVTGGEYVCGSV